MPKMRLRPRWGSLQRFPYPLAGLKGPTSKGRGGHGGGSRKEGRREKRWEGKGDRKGEREGKGHTGTSFSALRALVKPTLGYVSLSHLSRRDAVTLTRLYIGHTRFSHSYLLNQEDQPWCTYCDCALTVVHIHMLLECFHYNIIRHKILFHHISWFLWNGQHPHNSGFYWPTVRAPLVSNVVCRLSVCNILYCGETAHPS